MKGMHMAIAIEMIFEGVTLEQYDQVVQKMGFEPHGAGAVGGLFHWVTSIPNGIRVVDVWKTQAEYEQFAQDKIGPITASVGVTEPPRVTISTVHNYLTAG